MSVPTTNTIKNIHRKAAETGTLEVEVRSGRPRSSGSHENLDLLHQSLVENPHLSVRARARETDIPRESVRRLLRNDLQAYPFKPKILQALSEEDKAMRHAFCEEMSTILENDATFLDQLVFTDEANFHLNGTVNRHNCRYWAKENLNFIISEPNFHQAASSRTRRGQPRHRTPSPACLLPLKGWPSGDLQLPPSRQQQDQTWPTTTSRAESCFLRPSQRL